MGVLDGQVALVTGGSRGIGRAICLELAREGAAVVVNYRTHAAEADAVVTEIRSTGGRAESFAADVASETDTKALLAFAGRAYGRLDILVCNAGIVRDHLLGAMKADDWDDVMRTNVRGVFLTVREALPQMMSQRSGSIVTLSSVAAERGGRGHANYVASKGAINALTKSLAVELAPRSIRVNAVAPGVIATDMTARIRMFAETEIQSQIPLRRLGNPEDVARAVRFLASPDASYITGQVLHVTGGFGV
jgi:3-oxoacyl-[acyl-carrier protein] reductase